MGQLAEYIIFFIEGILFLIGIYYLAVGTFSFSVKRKKPLTAKENTFALVVAAHNEEAVIGDLIESLNNLDYNSEKYDIFVVADNCTDNTASLAESKGAKVLRRFNNVKRGKGFALEYAFDYIFSLEKKYEYIAVFDADNIADKEFLKNMNNTVNCGYRAVQGYLDSKNPYDSWLTFSYSLWYWVNNRVAQLSRGNLDIGCRLGGTGLVIETELIKEYGWGATCLAEDTEFTLKLALNGIKVGWCNEAVIYDEKPIGMQTSYNQRVRWMQGLADVAKRFVKPLIKKAVNEKNAMPLHMLLNFWGDTLHPICLGLFTFISILAFITNINPNMEFLIVGSWTNPINSFILNFYVLASWIEIIVGLYADGKFDKRIIQNIGGFFVYMVSWIPIGIVGTLKKNNSEWFHTPHTAKKK